MTRNAGVDLDARLARMIQLVRDGRTLAEIAREVGLSASSVSAQLSRARREGADIPRVTSPQAVPPSAMEVFDEVREAFDRAPFDEQKRVVHALALLLGLNVVEPEARFIEIVETPPTPPCHEPGYAGERCDKNGPGGFMGHTCRRTS